jgi:oligopeptide/dipeptide ABC transporter ATP-binding protein
MTGPPLLRVTGLRTYFHTKSGPVRAVDDIDFTVRSGEVLGIVGESGCGKTVTGLSILRLIDPPGSIEPGSRVELRGHDLTALSEAEMRGIRGNRISMVFQEPGTSLNPVYTVGEQITEVLRHHRGASPKAAWERAVELLARVGIPGPGERARDYPHQLSGGMRQRVMIAIAIACEPDLLIADEPTTALDVTIQAEILELLADLRERLGMAMILVSHDLAVVAEVADRVLVMYAGQIIERASAEDLFRQPRHPYTEGLLRAIPDIAAGGRRLTGIPGSVPNPRRWPDGCRFNPRCPYAWERCREDRPPLLGVERESRCWLEEEPDRRQAAGAGWEGGP